MAITVVCQGCHTRFKVSEKFAGRKGPCPKCKIEIYIPKVEERVQIKHEHSEEHVRGASGKLVLEPIAREEFTFKPWMIGLIVGLTLGAFVAAFLLRLFLDDQHSDDIKKLIGFGGVLLCGPLLALGGYNFLRPDELEPYRGRALWIRAGLCGLAYAGTWLIYDLGVAAYMPEDWWAWIFVAPPFLGIGGLAALAFFDFDYTNGVLHYFFFAVVTLLLRFAAGIDLV